MMTSRSPNEIIVNKSSRNDRPNFKHRNYVNAGIKLKTENIIILNEKQKPQLKTEINIISNEKKKILYGPE